METFSQRSLVVETSPRVIRGRGESDCSGDFGSSFCNFLVMLSSPQWSVVVEAGIRSN